MALVSATHTDLLAASSLAVLPRVQVHEEWLVAQGHFETTTHNQDNTNSNEIQSRAGRIHHNLCWLFRFLMTASANRPAGCTGTTLCYTVIAFALHLHCAVLSDLVCKQSRSGAGCTVSA